MTKKCKNPECQKEVPDNMNYCSQDCVKSHIEQKKRLHQKTQEEKGRLPEQPQLIKDDEETINEIHEIGLMLGKSHSDGFVSGSHNAKILSYLRQKNEEVYTVTLAKLAWLCGIGQRYVKENYMAGIEAFGIIETFTNQHNVLKWRWIGIKALRNNGS